MTGRPVKKWDAHFDSLAELEDALSEAETNARSDWEMTFVSDIQARYKQYGDGLFMSDSQAETLNKIASGRKGR